MSSEHGSRKSPRHRCGCWLTASCHRHETSSVHHRVPSTHERSRRSSARMARWSPHGKAIEPATAARFRTTSCAMDPHRSRTAVVARLALRVYDGLVMARGGRRFRDGRLRTILQTAAHLHGIHVDGRPGPRHNAAGNFLRALPAPLGWKASEWDLLTEVVRYHRGAEPAARHKPFAQLSPEQRASCSRPGWSTCASHAACAGVA